jgi:hypothetical protein
MEDLSFAARKVADINNTHEDNVPSHYFIEDEDSVSHVVNPIFVEEELNSAITFFLTLPRHVPSTTTRETTANPTINYSWPWLRWTFFIDG